jgi:hypothetical protein
MERFSRPGQGSKAGNLSLNLLHWARQLLFFLMSTYLVFGPHLLCVPKNFSASANLDHGGESNILRRFFSPLPEN